MNTHVEKDIRSQILKRALIGAIAFGFLLAAGVQVAHSTEIIPSWGWEKPKDSDANAKGFERTCCRLFRPRSVWATDRRTASRTSCTSA